MEGSKTLVWSSEFPWARERNYSKLIDNLGRRLRKVSPAQLYTVNGRMIED